MKSFFLRKKIENHATSIIKFALFQVYFCQYSLTINYEYKMKTSINKKIFILII